MKLLTFFIPIDYGTYNCQAGTEAQHLAWKKVNNRDFFQARKRKTTSCLEKATNGDEKNGQQFHLVCFKIESSVWISLGDFLSPNNVTE